MSHHSKNKYYSDTSSPDKHYDADTKHVAFSYKVGPDPREAHSELHQNIYAGIYNGFQGNPGSVFPPDSLINPFFPVCPNPCPTCPSPCADCPDCNCPTCPACNCPSPCPTIPACPDCNCPSPCPTIPACPTCPACNCPSPCPTIPACPTCPACNCPSPCPAIPTCPACPACPDCDCPSPCPTIPAQQNLQLSILSQQIGNDGLTNVGVNLGAVVYSTGTDITSDSPGLGIISFNAPGLYEVSYAGDFTLATDTDFITIDILEPANNTADTVIPGAGLSITGNANLPIITTGNTFYVSTTTTTSIQFIQFAESADDLINDFTVTVRKIVL